MKEKTNKQESDFKMPGIFSFNMATVDIPVFKETRSEWVPYGDNNLYPDFLINLMNNSSKHNSLLKKKVNMTAGGGFTETPANKVFLENPYGSDDLNAIAFKCAYDLVLYGGYAMAVTWSKDKTKIARTQYIDYRSVRVAKVLNDKSDLGIKQDAGLDFFFISSDWSQYRKDAHKPKLIQGFSKEFKDEVTQLVYVQEYRPGTDFYSLPDYISGMKWIELDWEIANFHLSSARNGFTPSMIISFKGGIPSEEEMKKLSRKINKQYAGTDNGSKVFITYSENGETAPEFIPVNLNASDERFLQLEEEIQANIVIAHGATPIVAGIATAGKLGSAAEIVEAEQKFQKDMIDNKQMLLESGFNKIAKINGIDKLELAGIMSFPEINTEITPEPDAN